MHDHPRVRRAGAFSFDIARDLAVWHDAEMYRIFARSASAGPIGPSEFAEAWLHPHDLPAYQDALDCVLAARETVEIEVRIFRGGEQRWLRMHMAPDAATVGARLVGGTACDVTEAKAGEAVLAADEETYRQLSDQSPAMLWMGDENGRCVYLNRALREFWGVEGDDLCGFDWGATVHPDDREKLAGPFTEGMSTRSAFELAARYRRADGVWRTLRTMAHPRFSSIDGAFAGMVGINIDITDRLAADRAVRESEKLKDGILNASLDAVVTIDDQGRFLEFNAAAERLFGYARNAVIGRSMSEHIVPARMRNAHGAGMKRHLESGEARILNTRMELPALKADGTEFPAEITVVRIADVEPPIFTAFVRDISERKRAEEHTRMLMGELNHRTKNILSVVQAVARQTVRHATPETFAGSFYDRLTGLAASNDLLLRHNWTGVDLEELARAQLIHLNDLIGRRIRIGGPTITIASTAAQTLGMAIHELSTNSIKHGALSVPEGTVALEWVIEAGGERPAFRMTWTETAPNAAREPQRKGFGHSVIVDMVAAALDAEVTVDFGAQGFRWSLAAPIGGTVST